MNINRGTGSKFNHVELISDQNEKTWRHRESEREKKESVCLKERERENETVRMKERKCACVCVCVCVRKIREVQMMDRNSLKSINLRPILIKS